MVTWPALIHLPVAPGPVTGQALSAARGSLCAQCELVAVSLGPSVEIHGCCLSFCFCSLVLSVLMVLKPRHRLQSQAGSLSGNCPECVSGPTMSFHLLFSKTVISILRWRKKTQRGCVICPRAPAGAQTYVCQTPNLGHFHFLSMQQAEEKVGEKNSLR